MKNKAFKHLGLSMMRPKVQGNTLEVGLSKITPMSFKLH